MRVRNRVRGQRGESAATLDASWLQGRGVFGGLVGALLVDAMIEAVQDPERHVRSFTVHFCAPAPSGEVTVTPAIVRSGNRVTHATAQMRAKDEVVAFASASFAKSREALARYALATMPAAPALETLSEFPPGTPMVPRFFDHVEARFFGNMPFSGAKAPGLSAWVRFREAKDALVDAGMAVMLLDSLPPAVLAVVDTPRPLASVDFRVDFFSPLPDRTTPKRAHHLVAITSRHAGDGYAEERRDLWSPDGRLLAQCQQLFAML